MSPIILPIVGYTPSPVANVKVMVSALTDKRFAVAITNKEGFFRVALTPGTYQVTLSPLGGMAFSKDVPATITIKEEGEVWMEIRDSELARRARIPAKSAQTKILGDTLATASG